MYAPYILCVLRRYSMYVCMYVCMYLYIRTYIIMQYIIMLLNVRS